MKICISQKFLAQPIRLILQSVSEAHAEVLGLRAPMGGKDTQEWPIRSYIMLCVPTTFGRRAQQGGGGCIIVQSPEASSTRAGTAPVHPGNSCRRRCAPKMELKSMVHETSTARSGKSCGHWACCTGQTWLKKSSGWLVVVNGRSGPLVVSQKKLALRTYAITLLCFLQNANTARCWSST